MEIKFRVWDEESKKLYMQDDFILTFDKVGDDVFVNIDDEIIPLYDYELMQYTGLKDCKGIEIYKGDIVKFKFDGEIKISEVKADVLNGAIVSFKSFGHDYNFNLSRIYSEDRRLEVIGNIYENKELLEK